MDSAGLLTMTTPRFGLVSRNLIRLAAKLAVGFCNLRFFTANRDSFTQFGLNVSFVIYWNFRSF